MRKALVVGVALLIVGGALAPASAGKAKKQTVEGTIAAPARHPDGCYTGLSRHLWSLFGDPANGVLGWTFDVDKATWNGKFKLEPTGGLGTVDLDLSYYLGDFASREEWANEPLPAAPATSEYETHDGPGEAGTVPEGAVKAVVCVYASEGGASAGVPFTYEATAPAKKKKR